jgi:hypothetical protein
MNSFQYGFFDELEKMGGLGDTLREYAIAARRSAKPTLRDMRSTAGLATLPAGLAGLSHAVPDSPFAYNVASAVTAVPVAAKAYQDVTGNFSDRLRRVRTLREAMKKTAAAGVATKTNPGLWARAKAQAKAKMGGKHSARAMQLATQIYKKGGGGYSGRKPSASSNKMVKWTKQKWRTGPGTSPIAKKESGRTSRYLPEKKWHSLSKGEQVATDKKKLSSSNQFVSNTPAAKVRSRHKYT